MKTWIAPRFAALALWTFSINFTSGVLGAASAQKSAPEPDSEVVVLPPMDVVAERPLRPPAGDLKPSKEILPRITWLKGPVHPPTVSGIGALVDFAFDVGTDGHVHNISPRVTLLDFTTKKGLDQKAIELMVKMGQLPPKAATMPLADVRMMLALRFAEAGAQALREAKFEPGRDLGKAAIFRMQIRFKFPETGSNTLVYGLAKAPNEDGFH